MADYKLGRRAPECAATGKPFAEGEEIISAVFLEDEGFERRDYSVEGFQGVTDHFSFWRAHVPTVTPTAGYYQDGLRFLKDVDTAIRKLQIDRELLIRSR